MNYWDQHYRDKVDESDDRYFQVGKTQYGVPVEKNQVDLIVQSITKALEPTKSDRLIDIGCGNGLLTEQLVPKVAHIIGIDRSEALLHVARSCKQNTNVEFIHCAIGSPEFQNISASSGITKAFSYEVIQLLEVQEVSELLILFESSVLTKLFIGGIPDKAKLEQFYDSTEKMDFYRKSIADGKPHLGRWWTIEELSELCERHQLKAQYLPQNKSLYTSHYRFDLLIEKQS